MNSALVGARSPRSPAFKPRSFLTRYLRAEWRKRNGRVSPAAFRLRTDEASLSVNSTEVETVPQIASYYANRWHWGERPVTLVAPMVKDYNDAASVAELTVARAATDGAWVYDRNGGQYRAYRHVPIPLSPSHCSVEFVAALDERGARRFAVSIAAKKRYKSL